MPDDQRPSREVVNGARFIESGNWLHSDFVRTRNSATTPGATFFCIANATWPIVIRGLSSTTGLTRSSPPTPRYKNASTPKQPAKFREESSAARRGSSQFTIALSFSPRSASRNCLTSGAQSKNGLLNRVPTYLRPAVTRDRVQPRHFVKLFCSKSSGVRSQGSEGFRELAVFESHIPQEGQVNHPFQLRLNNRNRSLDRVFPRRESEAF